MKWKNYIWALCYFILILLSFSVQLADAQQVTRPKKSLLPYHDFYKIRSGLPHFYHKIKNHRPVTVAFLGGSITYNPGWRNKICKYFRKHFPHEKFHFIDAGIPSLGSLPNAFRLQHDVLNKGKISLMFVEAAVNDRVNGTDSLTQIRDLEGIVRHAKRGNPNMDMIFMSFDDTVKLNDYGAGRIPMAVHNHELVARHYGLPSINLAKEVYEKINAGEFSWKYDFKNLHPSPFGERLYFKSIKALLNACFKRSDSSGGAIPKYHMPDKMNKYSFGRGEYYPIQKAQLGKGWQLVNNWYPPSSDQVHTRKRFTHVPVIELLYPVRN
jgi:sialidase-1